VCDKAGGNFFNLACKIIEKVIKNEKNGNNIKIVVKNKNGLIYQKISKYQFIKQ